MKLKNKILIILAFILILFLSIDNKVHATYDVTVDGTTYNLPDIPEDIEYTQYILYCFWAGLSDGTTALQFDFWYTNDPDVSYAVYTSYPYHKYIFYNDNNDVLTYNCILIRNNMTYWTDPASSPISCDSPHYYDQNHVMSETILSSTVDVYLESYSKDNLVFQKANRVGSSIPDSGTSSGSSDGDNESSESSDTGWLSSIGNWFSNLFDKIGNLANDIGSAISNVFSTVITGIASLVDYLLPNPLEDDDEWIVTDLLELLGELLRKLFIPEENYLSNMSQELFDKLNEKIPFYDYLDKLEKTISTESDTGDVSLAINLENYSLLDKAKISLKNFIKLDRFLNYRDTWFAWIRAVTYPLIILYNINQILKLLGSYGIIENSTSPNSDPKTDAKFSGGGKE